MPKSSSPAKPKSLAYCIVLFIQQMVEQMPFTYLGIAIFILRKQGTKVPQVHPALLNPHLPQAVPARIIMAQTFDGPPTIKRSGSEHRRAVTSSLFGQERGLVRDVEPSLMVKKDGMILGKRHYLSLYILS